MLQLKYKCLTVSFLLLKEIQTEAHQSVMQSNIKSKSPQHANSNTLYCIGFTFLIMQFNYLMQLLRYWTVSEMTPW